MNQTLTCRAGIIGGGIAGAALAAALSSRGYDTVVLEMEAQPGYHSTGRSAAAYLENYGNPVVRALTRASRCAYWEPASGFSDVPLVHARPELYIARPEDYAHLDQALSTLPGFKEVSRAQVRELCPILRPEVQWRAGIDHSAADLDVSAILQAFLRHARACGAQILTNSEVLAVERRDDFWELRTAEMVVKAPILINAAGAWADSIAHMAGLAPLGIVPHRRTALLVDAPVEHDVRGWPMVVDVRETFYFKPDAGRILISPADETPTPPADAQPDDMDVAIAVDRFESATTLGVHRVASSWAGLRSFARDRSPVIGFDPRAEGFFWYAAHGGYGIQMAPGAAKAAAALIDNGALPSDLIDSGVDASALSPARLLT